MKFLLRLQGCFVCVSLSLLPFPLCMDICVGVKLLGAALFRFPTVRQLAHLVLDNKSPSWSISIPCASIHSSPNCSVNSFDRLMLTLKNYKCIFIPAPTKPSFFSSVTCFCTSQLPYIIIPQPVFHLRVLDSTLISIYSKNSLLICFVLYLSP